MLGLDVPVQHLGLYLGLYLYLAIFTIPDDLGLDHWQLIHAVPGKSVTITSARENTEARAIFFASPTLTYAYRDTRQQQEILAGAFGAEQWEVPRLLAAMRTRLTSTLTQSARSSWTAGPPAG